MICQVFALLTPFLRFGCAMSWETLHLSKTVNHFLMINWFLVTFRVLNGGKWWIWNWDKRNAFLIFTLWWLFRFHNFSNSLEDASLQENFLTLESAEKIYNSNLFSSFTICVLEFSLFRLNIICIRKHKRGRGRGLVCQWKPIEVERIFAIFFFVCVFVDLCKWRSKKILRICILHWQQQHQNCLHQEILITRERRKKWQNFIAGRVK